MFFPYLSTGFFLNDIIRGVYSVYTREWMNIYILYFIILYLIDLRKIHLLFKSKIDINFELSTGNKKALVKF